MRPGLLAAVLTTSLTVGAASGATVEEEVTKLSDQAVDAYKSADYQRAVTLLTRAYAIRPLPALLYNLAKAYDKLADADNAYENYKKYVESGEADPKLEDKARKRMAFFEPQLKPKEPPKPEKPPEPVVTTPPEPTGPPPEDEDAKRRRLKLIALFGGGGAALAGAVLVIAGGALYSSAASKRDQFGATQEESMKRALRDQAQSAGTTSTALYAVGGVLLGVGAAAIVVAFALPQLQPGGGGESAPAEAPVSVSPWIGPDGAGVGASWRF